MYVFLSLSLVADMSTTQHRVIIGFLSFSLIVFVLIFLFTANLQFNQGIRVMG